MAATRKEKRPADSDRDSASRGLPEGKSPSSPAAWQPYVARKRPWLLALSIVLMAGWIAFLAAMAWRG